MSKKEQEKRVHKIDHHFKYRRVWRPSLCLGAAAVHQRVSADWRAVNCKRCLRKAGRR